MAVGFLVSSALPLNDALAAQPPVGLGTADSFAVLAGSTVTNTGPSVINGNLGVSPGAAVTGFPPGTVNGVIHRADAVATQAKTDLTTAYNDAAGRTPALSVSGDLGGLTLTPGVYRSGSSLALTGALTLDAQGDPNAVFIFQAGSTLTTASASRVNVINGAQPCNVFWQIGSSATLGTSSVFTGNILALTSISMGNDVTVRGRALARNGAVTLINDTITAARCAAGTTGGGGGGPGGGGGGQPGGGGEPGGGGGAPGGGGGEPGGGGQPGGGGPGASGNGVALFTTNPRSVARRVLTYGTSRCVNRTFRVVVSGLFIRRVVFSLDGRTIATRSRSPFTALVSAGRGRHTVRAHVTFRDGTRAANLRMRYRQCASAARRFPFRRPRGPSGFTG